MIHLAPGETIKHHFYNDLTKKGYILPSFQCSAVTVESLLKFKEPGYYCPYYDELVPYIRDPRKLIAPTKFAFEMLRRFIAQTMHTQLPFSKCPDKNYLRAIALLCDSSNELKLLSEHTEIEEVVHILQRDGQFIKFVEPSKHNKQQKLYDKINNLRLKAENKILAYEAALEENKKLLQEKRAQAKVLLNGLNEEKARELRADPSLRILFEDITGNDIFLINDSDYRKEMEIEKLFQEKNYSRCALKILEKYVESHPEIYIRFRPLTTTTQTLKDLNDFIDALHQNTNQPPESNSKRSDVRKKGDELEVSILDISDISEFNYY